MKNKYDIFISHSADDKGKVKEIAELLVNEGLKIWFDDWNLTVGENWRESISQAINESNAVLIYISQKGINKWNITELNEAIKFKDKRIIPILERGVSLDAIPAFLRDKVVLKTDDENFLRKLVFSTKSSKASDQINFEVKDLVAKGNYNEALEKSKQVIRIIKENKQIDESAATAYNNLGLILRNQGNYQEAISSFEEALNLIQQSNSKNQETTTLSNLANVYTDIGQYDKATKLLEKTLQTDLQNFGENHPNVAVRLSNLANVYSHLAHYDKAMELLERALQIDLQNFGENHPNVAVRLSNLANVYSHLAHYDKAMELLERALQIDLQNFGESHPTVAMDKSNLAIIYISMKNYQKALPFLQSALRTYEETYSRDHPRTEDIRNILKKAITKDKEH